MLHVTLRFYAAFNAFLPRARRKVTVMQRLTDGERAAVVTES